MKITTNQLRRIIAEEVQRSLNEATPEEMAAGEKKAHELLTVILSKLEELKVLFPGGSTGEDVENAFNLLNNVKHNM